MGLGRERGVAAIDVRRASAAAVRTAAIATVSQQRRDRSFVTTPAPFALSVVEGHESQGASTTLSTNGGGGGSRGRGLAR